MSKKGVRLAAFLEEIMERRARLPSQLAVDLGITHTTIRRWLDGKDVPNIRSCQKLAEYSGVSLQRVLSITGHIPEIDEGVPANWPEFDEYARRKYPKELDEDLISMIAHLIRRRRQRRYGKTGT